MSTDLPATAPPALDAATTLRERAERDPHRPRFHFTSPAGWLNDPNGLSQWDGVYHLFYQYNPYAPVHSRIHWGHATSRDLVTWTDQPIALVPGDDGPDRDGCWSGVLVDDGGTPTLVYSGRHGEHELPCVAVGSPDLLHWIKDPANPVIPAPPDDVEITAFRDHCVWRENGRWRQIVGSGIKGVGGTALLYESNDLRAWRYLGPLLVGDAANGGPEDVEWTGTMWECVDLFQVCGTDILVFSAWHDGITCHPLYWSGRYDGDYGQFTARSLHRLDYGRRYFYAPQSTCDPTGRRTMFGWIQEGRPDTATAEAGWSGVMSLPRLISIGLDGALVQQPAPEVQSLRRDQINPLTAPEDFGESGMWTTVPDLRGDQLDIELSARLAPGATLRIAVRESSDGSEHTIIELSRASAHPDALTLRLDRENSSLDRSTDREPLHGDAPTDTEGRLELRVLIDHSVIEIFANGRALTSRIYPTRSDALGASISLREGAALERLEAWHMADIWDAPRPSGLPSSPSPWR